jgi:hypothetical protein
MVFLVLMNRVDKHKTGHLILVSERIQLHDRPTIGVPDQHVRSGDTGPGEKRGLAPSTHSVDVLRAIGVTPLLGDVEDLDSLRRGSQTPTE